MQRIGDHRIVLKVRWIDAWDTTAAKGGRTRIADIQAAVPHVPRALDLEIRAGVVARLK